MINATIKGKEKVVEAYPCLKEGSDGLIVLFESSTTGVVVFTKNSNPKYYALGKYRTDWIPHSFMPFTGEVILSNKEK